MEPNLDPPSIVVRERAVGEWLGPGTHQHLGMVAGQDVLDRDHVLAVDPQSPLTSCPHVSPTRRREAGDRILPPVAPVGIKSGREHEGQAVVTVDRRRGRDLGMVREKSSTEVAGTEGGVRQGRHQHRPVGGHAGHACRAQGSSEDAGCLAACRGVGDHLRQQRVVVGRHRVAGAHTGIDSHIAGDAEIGEGPGRRHPVAGGVLGDEPGLDRMTGEADVVLGHGQRLARRDPQLQLDQVEAGDHLGDRMLDLEPGVHLQERDRAIGPDQVLDGARSLVSRSPSECHRPVEKGLSELVAEVGCGGFLDDLLIATLDRAVPFTQMDHVAVGVTDDLHLHVTSVLDERLDEDRSVTEGALGFTGGSGHGIAQCADVHDGSHPASATAGRRLHQSR